MAEAGWRWLVGDGGFANTAAASASAAIDDGSVLVGGSLPDSAARGRQRILG